MTDENIHLFGIKPLKEMTREEMIDEILEAHRIEMGKMNDVNLRANVANIRLQEYKQRLMAEAGIAEGPMGMFVIKEDDDD